MAMETLTVAKEKKNPDEPPAPDDDTVVTTVKARKRVARIVRQIGAHQDINQEDVLDIFAPQMEEYLHNLMATKLKKRRAP